jgi:O-acetyl-ADP-ribose deacetylase
MLAGRTGHDEHGSEGGSRKLTFGCGANTKEDRGMRIELVKGDITEQQVDAIVNAANSSLLGGGGVDGAIHRRGGPEILAECKRIRVESYPDGLPTGEAVATTAGRLAATWVIHTVGPVFSRSEDRSHLLARCHAQSLDVAHEVGARTVAFPAISTGVYGYPLELAAPVAIRAVADAETHVDLVRFVLFDGEAYDAFDRALRDAGGG